MTTDIDLTTPAGRAAFTALGGQRQNKYSNRRGDGFDSQAEASRYDALLLLEQAGDISELCVKPRYVLVDAFTTFRGERVRAITYTPDYQYRERGRLVCEDVKGGKATQTEVFKIKAKLFKLRYPDIELRIVEV